MMVVNEIGGKNLISVPVKKASIDYSYSELDGFTLTIEVGSGYTHTANSIKKLIDKNVPLEFILRKPEEDKTQKQLGALWAAIGEMANALGISKDEMYQDMIREHGKSKLMKVAKADIESIMQSHCDGRGNFIDIIGTAADDPQCAVIKMYWGCSTYNKAEMSEFLEGVDREHSQMFE